MTPDRIKNALVTWLEANKPDSDITVSDAQTFADAALPRISVGVIGVETHSPTLPGVQKVQLEIQLAAHGSDTDTRATVQGWCDTIEQMINDPATVKSNLRTLEGRLDVHHWLASGGTLEWDETVLTATWQAEAWVRRLS